MAGVRIVHESKRSCLMTLVDATRPLRAAMLCGACGREHRFKTYHITVDDQGAAIVSPEVLERLQRMPLTGFRVTNEVKRPPRLTIGLNGRGDLPPIEPHPTLKEPS